MSVKVFPCDLCGHDDPVEVPYVRFYTNNQPVHICRKCGFVYVRERRSAKEIADTWSNELFGEIYTSAWPAVKARLLYVAEFVDSTVGLKGKRVTEIGGGEGAFLELISRHYGAEVFGIEPSVQNCRAMNAKGLECFQGTIEEYAASGNPAGFDLAAILWTLENCMSCRDMLAAAHGLLKDDGHIVVATGSRILVPFKKPLDYYFSANPADTHAFRFSANTLRAMLAVCGFASLHINRYIDTDYLVVVAAKRPEGVEIEWKGDDYLAVYDFFERWHKESLHYRTRDA